MVVSDLRGAWNCAEGSHWSEERSELASVVTSEAAECE